MTKDEKFQKKVTKLMESFETTSGALTYGYTCTVQTYVGALHITLHSPQKRQKVFTVFMKFEDYDRAKAEGLVGMNCKVNIHRWDPDDAYDLLVLYLGNWKAVKKDSTPVSKYHELDALVTPIADMVAISINKNIQDVKSDMPYKAQYVLEEVIKNLEARV